MCLLLLIEAVVLGELEFVSYPVALVCMWNMHVFNTNLSAVGLLQSSNKLT